MAGVIIVDDSSFMRKRIAKSLEEAGFEITGHASDGAEGFRLYKDVHPDFVVMDITMRGTDGIEGAAMIKEYDPEARIIFMSLVSDPAVRDRALALGALGFVGKDQNDQLISLMCGKKEQNNGKDR